MIEVEEVPKQITPPLWLPTPIPLLSFFTGGGFLDLGFIQAGFDVIWCNDNNKVFANAYQYAMRSVSQHVSPSKYNFCSIENLTTNEIDREAFDNLGRPDVFGMIGGPPCPDFSVAGKNRGEKGDNGRLSQVYVDRILALQPTFFLFENVSGLAKTKKHRQFLSKILQQLGESYLIDVNLLNALDYGVPQDRERVFVIGFLRDWIHRNYELRSVDLRDNLSLLDLFPPSANEPLWKQRWLPWDTGRHLQNAKTTFNWPQHNPFGENPEKPPAIPDGLMAGTYICDTHFLAQLPNGLEAFRPYSNKFTWIPEGDDSRKSFKRLHRWRYSPAVAYGNNEVHLHPTEARRLTVREALRLQTAPDDYALPSEMALSHKFKLIGNGVPVRLARAIAQAVGKVLNLDISPQSM